MYFCGNPSLHWSHQYTPFFHNMHRGGGFPKNTNFLLVWPPSGANRAPQIRRSQVSARKNTKKHTVFRQFRDLHTQKYVSDRSFLHQTIANSITNNLSRFSGRGNESSSSYHEKSRKNDASEENTIFHPSDRESGLRTDNQILKSSHSMNPRVSC